jgi:catechol 2,3-dioxygenase-like lactoylglutathione lyase family enzyme
VALALASAELVAFVASSDLEASDRFYGGRLGLRLVDATELALVYDAGGSELRVTRVERPAAAPYTVLGWRVDDIAATIRELAGEGLSFTRYAGMRQDGDGVWTSPSGALVAWFEDPDGNTLSLVQRPRS